VNRSHSGCAERVPRRADSYICALVAGRRPGHDALPRLGDGTDQDFEVMRLAHERNLAELSDLHVRDQRKNSPNSQACVDVTISWDEVSFDADYPSEPLSTFELTVRSLLSRPWSPPGTA
jgi:hypothetical protein